MSPTWQKAGSATVLDVWFGQTPAGGGSGSTFSGVSNKMAEKTGSELRLQMLSDGFVIFHEM